jgi:tripartite-type tricarboxylate transporter receptor subunit TctC
LQARLRAVIDEPIVQQRAREMGAITVFRDQAAFQRFFDSEVARWSAIIAAEKLSAQ